MRVVLVGADMEENLGICMISAALTGARHEVFVVGFDDSGELDSVVRKVLAHRPAVVGLGMQFQHRAHEFSLLAKKLRSAGFRGHVTCGGQWPTMAWREALGRSTGIDSVVLHEGEADRRRSARGDRRLAGTSARSLASRSEMRRGEPVLHRGPAAAQGPRHAAVSSALPPPYAARRRAVHSDEQRARLLGRLLVLRHHHQLSRCEGTRRPRPRLPPAQREERRDRDGRALARCRSRGRGVLLPRRQLLAAAPRGFLAPRGGDAPPPRRVRGGQGRIRRQGAARLRDGRAGPSAREARGRAALRGRGERFAALGRPPESQDSDGRGRAGASGPARRGHFHLLQPARSSSPTPRSTTCARTSSSSASTPSIR